MKIVLLAPLALLIATACSDGADTKGSAGETAGGAETNSAQAAAIAANTRPDGSVIDESKPHEHTPENAHPEPMDMAMMTPQSGDSAATRGYKQAMMRMMQGMPPYTGDADIDFNKQMRIHHLAAIDMAEVHLAAGKDEASKALARKIIGDQKREVAQIDAWLQQRGQ
jgi:uncharacterized protein (DUF305 family)